MINAHKKKWEIPGHPFTSQAPNHYTTEGISREILAMAGLQISFSCEGKTDIFAAMSNPAPRIA
jgi:hypothetical protein